MESTVHVKVNPRRRFTNPDTGITHEAGEVVEVRKSVAEEPRLAGTIKLCGGPAPAITEIPVGDGPVGGGGDNADPGDEAQENAGEGTGASGDPNPAPDADDASTDEEDGEAGTGGDGAADAEPRS